MSPRDRDGPTAERQSHPLPTRGSQVLWFVGLWLAGLATVGTIAFVIRSVLL